MHTKDKVYFINSGLAFKLACDIRVGDYVKVKKWGDIYPSYKTAFSYFKMPENYIPNYDNLREHKRYVVLGIVVHENKRIVMAHISSLDGFQYVIGVKGLQKIGEINHNKLNEIRQNYKIECLGA
jgi:hypothetical protein